MTFANLYRTVVAFLSVATLAGCTLSDIKRQTLEVDAVSAVNGQVIVDSDVKGPIYVHAYLQGEQSLKRVRDQLTAKDGSYRFNLPPGRYTLAAFVDENGNAIRDDEEHGTYTGMENRYPALYKIIAGKEITAPDLVITGPIQRPTGVTIVDAKGKGLLNTGRVVSLEDPMFSTESARMALWRPQDFIQQHGGGLLFLQSYEAEKIPVVFVHGIGGSALEFRDIIASLDRERFQPWVFQYPSGYPLKIVSDFLDTALARIHAEHKFTRMVLIAHSMGGLMSRSFVLQHAASQAPYDIALAITINSPLYGMDSAAKGIKVSPLTIPSWRDVASGSDYVREVHATRWPEDVPYQLVFSYLPDQPGDGVVPIKSQLSRSLQAEATRIHGFEAGHATILREQEFIEFLNGLLADVDS